MLTFKPISYRYERLLRSYYSLSELRLCEYSLGTKLMWKDCFKSVFAESCGCLIVADRMDGVLSFNYPLVKNESSDVEGALKEIENYCIENETKLCFSCIPREKANLILRYDIISTDNPRIWRDYLYYANDIRALSGKKYNGQRNHLHRFAALYPDYKFRELTPEDDKKLEVFWQEYSLGFSKTSPVAVAELRLSISALSKRRNCYVTGALEVGDKLVAVCLGELCGNTLVIHIEKALTSYEGSYVTMVNEFAKKYACNVKYINREDDSGDRGLRTSKLQYHPADIADKLNISVFTVLDGLREFPSIKTERLILDKMTDADALPYYELATDEKLNQYWGYDYKKDLKGDLYENYFLDVARTDFDSRMAINFSVRYRGAFVGEVVLYRFDYNGGAEVGVRIASEYARRGFGKESLNAVCDWALYSLGLSYLVAKCYRRNVASQRLLSGCMLSAGEDEQYFHYVKKL